MGPNLASNPSPRGTVGISLASTLLLVDCSPVLHCHVTLLSPTNAYAMEMCAFFPSSNFHYQNVLGFQVPWPCFPPLLSSSAGEWGNLTQNWSFSGYLWDDSIEPFVSETPPDSLKSYGALVMSSALPLKCTFESKLLLIHISNRLSRKRGLSGWGHWKVNPSDTDIIAFVLEGGTQASHAPQKALVWHRAFGGAEMQPWASQMHWIGNWDPKHTPLWLLKMH